VPTFLQAASQRGQWVQMPGSRKTECAQPCHASTMLIESSESELLQFVPSGQAPDPTFEPERPDSGETWAGSI
jgi:hypothetical protein